MDDPFHVPQQSRRNKLRFTLPHPHQNDTVFDEPDYLSPLPLNNLHHHQHEQYSSMTSSPTGLNLSLSSSANQVRTGGGGYSVTPVGPFTGYASILGRSRFLRPAQELLEDFSHCHGVSFENATIKHGGGGSLNSKVMEESGSWMCEEDDDVSRRCSNPNLVNMLHEVYKKYRLYCQQMQSAVSSFESVAGLANAAPFIGYAVKAMARHFQCLKNAILDQIRLASRSFGGVDFKRDRASGSCSEDKGQSEPKQVPGSNFLQHPVWRSQRGFPDKAVTVLRTWLFDHFLHPYPSDSDKQMLAQKTGLSRSQVSNWFTNARVRLWKPMVEEMHALERKTQCSKAGDTSNFINLSADNHVSFHPQFPEKDFQIMNAHREQESQCKRSRIEVYPRAEQSREQFGLPCDRLPSEQSMSVGAYQLGSQLNRSSALSSDHENAAGLPWSATHTHGQIVPFWLARH